jgi:hypothetical protein
MREPRAPVSGKGCWQSSRCEIKTGITLENGRISGLLDGTKPRVFIRAFPKIQQEEQIHQKEKEHESRQEQNAKQDMRSGRNDAGYALMVSTGPLASAEDSRTVKLANLAEGWQATVIGEGPGFGFGSKLLNFTLNATGSSDIVSGIFTVTSLNTNGSGTAQLHIGDNILNFTIQMNPTSTVFNIAEYHRERQL